ncbi:MAG TPA: hypothetical protein VFZ59_14740 [Verrucomicrobiae bacterium]|nr:hypothetical protein [Verrucomicrobiae bacterium]
MDLALFFALIPALATARVSHTFSWFAHPWQDVSQDMLIFTFAVFAVVVAIPVLARGTAGQRISAVALLVFPAYTLSTFLIWSLRQT